MKFILFFVALYISILIHELGHYLVSKTFKVPVKDFCIGFGPKLFKFNKFNTTFTFKPIPLGGYISNDPKDLDRISLFKEWLICLAGITVNLIAATISLSFYFNRNLLLTFKLILTKLLAPLFTVIITPSTYFGAEASLSSNLSTTLNSFQSNEFFLVFAVLNISLFAFNLLPIPILDGGQLIMSIFRRWGNKSKKRNAITSKISNIIYLICWMVLLSPLIINEALKFYNPFQIALLFIMGILLALLFRVVSQTDMYKNIIKK